MAGEVKDGTVSEGGDALLGIDGVSESGLYAGLETATGGKQTEMPVIDVSKGGNGETQDNEPSASPEKPTAEEPAKTESKEPKEVKPPWDADRQKRDQEFANLRKQHDELKRMYDAAEERAAQAETFARQQEMVRTTRTSDTILAEISDIAIPDPLDDPAGFSQGQQRLAYLQKELARATKLEADSSVAALTAPQRDAQVLEDILNRVSGNDRDVRNSILEGLQKEWQERGYNADNMPTNREVEALAEKHRAFYDRDLVKNGKSVPKRITPPATDTTRTGDAPTLANRMRPCTTLEEAVADLKRNPRR